MDDPFQTPFTSLKGLVVITPPKSQRTALIITIKPQFFRFLRRKKGAR